MWQKLYFGFVVLFFLLMNALLWRSIQGNEHRAHFVPVDSVLRRLLEAADDSILEIRHRGVKIGNCHWSASIQTSQSAPAGPNDSLPEGMVASISSYHVECDGTVNVQPLGPLRFKYALLLDTNQAWREMEVSLALRPSPLDPKPSGMRAWEATARSIATNDTLAVSFSQGREHLEQTYSLAGLDHPQNLLAALATGPFAARFHALGLPLDALLSPGALPAFPSSSVSWKARASHRKIGHSRVPVYYLEASLLETSLLVVCILESGEILGVELPGECDLVNAELLSM